MHPTEILQLRETKILRYFFKSFCYSKINGRLQTCTHIYISVPSCASGQIQSKNTCTWVLARRSCSACCPWQTHAAASARATGARAVRPTSCQVHRSPPKHQFVQEYSWAVAVLSFKMQPRPQDSALAYTALVQKNTSKEGFRHKFSIKILGRIPYIYIHMPCSIAYKSLNSFCTTAQY